MASSKLLFELNAQNKFQNGIGISHERLFISKNG